MVLTVCSRSLDLVFSGMQVSWRVLFAASSQSSRNPRISPCSWATISACCGSLRRFQRAPLSSSSCSRSSCSGARSTPSQVQYVTHGSVTSCRFGERSSPVHIEFMSGYRAELLNDRSSVASWLHHFNILQFGVHRCSPDNKPFFKL